MNPKQLEVFHKSYEVSTTRCWEWVRTRLDNSGYAHYGQQPAHRTAYEHFKGPIPAGFTLDHRCSVRHCVNPDHLEPAT